MFTPVITTPIVKFSNIEENINVKQMAGSVEFSYNFGENNIFKVNYNLILDDVDFKLPNLDIDDNCFVLFQVDNTPKKGFVIDEFKMPKQNVNVRLRGVTKTPSNQYIEALVHQPTYVFCSEDLDCDNRTVVPNNSQDIKGFNRDSNLLESICERPSWDPTLKCFGFKLSNYPLKVYPNLCLTNMEDDCPENSHQLDVDNFNIGSVIDGNVKEATVYVTSSVKSSNPIDFSQSPVVVNWSITAKDNKTYIAIRFDEKTNKGANQVKITKGILDPIVSGTNPDIALGLIKLTTDVSISGNALKRVSLENTE